MAQDPSNCMVVLMHALCTMHLTIPNLMAMVLLCVVLETEMFTLNFFLQAKTFLRPNFTTRMYKH